MATITQKEKLLNLVEHTKETMRHTVKRLEILEHNNSYNQVVDLEHNVRITEAKKLDYKAVREKIASLGETFETEIKQVETGQYTKL